MKAPNALKEIPAELAAALTHWHGAKVVDALDAKLSAVAAAMDHAVVTVGFAGHFSSGKSSVLNTLMGREILPTSDFPETGVPCWIRRGQRDQAQAIVAGQPVEMPLSRESIAGVVTLVGADGDFRAEPGQVTDVYLTVADSAVPAGANWVDLPGVNDTETMNSRVMAAVGRLDVLVWVVDSRRPMSETEQDHLAEITSGQNIEDMVFVVNVFLRKDTQESWQDFLDRRAAFHYRKIADLGENLAPKVAFLSARAATADPTGFGRAESCRLIESLADAQQPRVRAARRRRAAAQVRQVAAELAPMIASTTKWFEGRLAEFDSRQRTLDDHRQRFREALAAVIDWHLRRHAPAIERCGHFVAAEIIPRGPLRRDGFYAAALAHHIHEVIGVVVLDTITAAGRCAAEYGYTAPTSYTAEEVRVLLAPAEVYVDTPESSPDGGIRGVVAEKVGLTVGVTKPSSAAIGRDRAATQENTVLAARQIAVDILSRAGTIADLLAAACRPYEPAPPRPDRGPLDVLEELQEHLESRAREFDRQESR